MKIELRDQWKIHQDREEDDPEIDSYTISLSKEKGGWNTDMGYAGYGLPKDLAQWIVDVLNKHGEFCPFIMNEFGYWERK